MHAKVVSMALIKKLQRKLQLQANSRTKAWWEGYLKHVIPFRGVTMAGVRASLHAWIRDEQILTTLSKAKQKDLALGLFRGEHAEDKLAGILFLQEVLLPAGAVSFRADLPKFAKLFSEGYIYEWNICDWFCVKVLGPLVEREGRPCALALSRWSKAKDLWQRRASVVAFVNLAKLGDGNFPGFTDVVLQNCAALLKDRQRFAQTGAGWVLRELSRAEPERVSAFIRSHLEIISQEGLRYAVAQLPAKARAGIVKPHR
jgi:3-methyladenine DNA glycosylase AlkD